MDIPVLELEDAPDQMDPPAHVGLPRLLWRGEELGFPTMDDYQLTMSDQGFTKLTITFPVRVRVVPHRSEP